MEILQVFFLRDLQDLASLALKMKFFLQDIENFARILQEKLQDNFLARFDQNLSRKLAILQIFLARFSISRKKSSFLVQDLQDLVKDLASLARKILARFRYFLQAVFTGIRPFRDEILTAIFILFITGCIIIIN